MVTKSVNVPQISMPSLTLILPLVPRRTRASLRCDPGLCVIDVKQRVEKISQRRNIGEMRCFEWAVSVSTRKRQQNGRDSVSKALAPVAAVTLIDSLLDRDACVIGEGDHAL